MKKTAGIFLILRKNEYAKKQIAGTNFVIADSIQKLNGKSLMRTEK
jgi:hypothetical protein